MAAQNNPITASEQAEYDKRAAEDAAKLKAYRAETDAYALRSVLGLETQVPGISFEQAQQQFRQGRRAGRL